MAGTGGGPEPQPTPSLTLLMVGPDAIEGDVRAGQYFILDTDTMKQVVGSQAEVTDNYKEYLGEITWSIVDGDSIASIDAGSSTEGSVSISGSDDFTVRAVVNGEYVEKTATATYYITDFYITSLADLQELQRVINNSLESTISLTQNTSSSYVATNGNGLSGAHLRLTNDINCNSTNLHIGYCYHSADLTDLTKFKAFRGIFDGAGYRIYNIGGTITSHSVQSTHIDTCLFEALCYAKLFNFSVEGSVIKNSYTNTIFGYAKYCDVKRIYTNIYYDRTTNNSTNQYVLPAYLFANSTVDSMCFNDNQYGARTATCSTWPQNDTFSRIISLTTSYNIGSNASTSFGLCCPNPPCTIENFMAINYLQSDKTYGNHNNGGVYGISANVANGAVMTNCYFVHNGGSCSSNYTWAIRTGGKTATKTNCFFDSNKHGGDVSSDEGATGKTTAQLKSGNIFGGNANWIEKSGYYPLLNIQFAVRPEVLAAIRVS